MYRIKKILNFFLWHSKMNIFNTVWSKQLLLKTLGVPLELSYLSKKTYKEF